jgi:peroxiredoxin
MKKIFLYIALFLPAIAFAQTPQQFTIKGKIANAVPPAKVYLFYTLGANRMVDSCAISVGSFTITGTVLNPVNATLLYDHKGVGLEKLDNSSADMLNLYLESGMINVNAIDSIAAGKITGSVLNEDNAKLMAQLTPIITKAKKIQYDAQRATLAQQQSAEYQNFVQGGLKAAQTQQQTVLTTYIKSNPKSYLSLLALSSLGGPTADPAPLLAMYDSLDPSLKDMEVAKQLKKSIDGLMVTSIGAVAPDFTQADADGKPVKLSSFRGKYVLLDFWASWCGPCRQENPNVVRAYNKYKSKNFTILGVSLDKPGAKDAWQAAVKSDGLVWTQVSDLKFWDNEAAGLYAVRAIPQNYLIDPQGKIIGKNLRGEELQKKLAELFPGS